VGGRVVRRRLPNNSRVLTLTEVLAAGSDAKRRTLSLVSCQRERYWLRLTALSLLPDRVVLLWTVVAAGEEAPAAAVEFMRPRKSLTALC
jgi:hypothetical protein